MKSIKVFFLLVFVMSICNAQDFTISFKATGTVSILTFIQVKNLTKGTNKPLNGTDVLHLKGPSAINDHGSNDGSVLIFPNPTHGKAELSFYAGKTGNVQLLVFDVSGKKVIENNNKVTQGTHKYEIQGLKEGIYFIKISGNGYEYHEKLISSNPMQKQPDIKYLGILAINNILKTDLTTVEMYYEWGDSMCYIGFSNTLVDTVYDKPSSSKTITFVYPSIPNVTTNTISGTSYFTSVCGGNVTNDGGSAILARGVCWSTSAKPTLSDNYTTDGSGMGSYTSNIIGLAPNTNYFIRAYATNKMGTAYGIAGSFLTTEFIAGKPYEGGLIGYILKSTDPDYEAGKIKGIIVPPTDQSKAIQWYNGSSIKTDATGLGIGDGNQNTETIVAVQGSGSYAAKLCADLVLSGYSDWFLPSKWEMEEILTNKVAIGGFADSFYWTSTELSYKPKNVYFINRYNITGDDTTKNMKYAVRAARYLNPVFSLPVLTTIQVTSIAETTAKSGGIITSDGGNNVTERGVCWNTKPNPTTSNSKLTDGGNGRGSFSSDITGLSPSTIYYIRAYATTISGTSYGNEVTFNTVSDVPSTTVITDITQTTAKSGGIVTKDGGSAITARGVCWSVNPTPAVSDSKTSDGTGLGQFSSNITGLSPKTKYYVRAYATNGTGTVYGNILSFITEQATAKTVTDFDGNIYDTVHIGSQIWMKQNLKAIHYSNGDIIPKVTDNTAWSTLTSGAYCDYDNTSGNSAIYGNLYNWFAVNDSRYLCPAGWHVPSKPEWETLLIYLGNASVAGGKLKETGTSHWLTPNTAATNSSHFTALPGGGRDLVYSFVFLNYMGFWWSSTDYYTGDGTAWNLYLEYDKSKATFNNGDLKLGFSVRCIKN